MEENGMNKLSNIQSHLSLNYCPNEMSEELMLEFQFEQENMAENPVQAKPLKTPTRKPEQATKKVS